MDPLATAEEFSEIVWIARRNLSKTEEERAGLATDLVHKALTATPRVALSPEVKLALARSLRHSLESGCVVPAGAEALVASSAAHSLMALARQVPSKRPRPWEDAQCPTPPASPWVAAAASAVPRVLREMPAPPPVDPLALERELDQHMTKCCEALFQRTALARSLDPPLVHGILSSVPHATSPFVAACALHPALLDGLMTSSSSARSAEQFEAMAAVVCHLVRSLLRTGRQSAFELLRHALGLVSHDRDLMQRLLGLTPSAANTHIIECVTSRDGGARLLCEALQESLQDRPLEWQKLWCLVVCVGGADLQRQWFHQLSRPLEAALLAWSIGPSDSVPCVVTDAGEVCVLDEGVNWASVKVQGAFMTKEAFQSVCELHPWLVQR
jgi:hypothetical protein